MSSNFIGIPGELYRVHSKDKTFSYFIYTTYKNVENTLNDDSIMDSMPIQTTVLFLNQENKSSLFTRVCCFMDNKIIYFYIDDVLTLVKI